MCIVYDSVAALHIYKKSRSLKDDAPLYHHNCFELPTYFQSRKILTTSEILNTIFDLDLSVKFICKRTPRSVNCNAFDFTCTHPADSCSCSHADSFCSPRATARCILDRLLLMHSGLSERLVSTFHVFHILLRLSQFTRSTDPDLCHRSRFMLVPKHKIPPLIEADGKVIWDPPSPWRNVSECHEEVFYLQEKWEKCSMLISFLHSGCYRHCTTSETIVL